MSTTGLGYAPFLLQHLKVVAAENAPETKITPTGLLKMMLQNPPTLKIPDYERLRLTNERGNIKTINLKYLTRVLPSSISSSDDCDNDALSAYQQISLQAPKIKKYSFWIADEDIARYEDEAAKSVMLGTPATEFMQEHLTVLMTTIQGMLGAINQDLISQVVFGTNIVSGNSGLTPTGLNIPLNLTNNDLTAGLGKLLADAEQNEYAGMPLIVGGGKFNTLMKQKGFTGMAFNGLDNARALDELKWYYDNYTQAAQNAGTPGWGANNIGVFSRNSIGFVDLQKYIGFRAGKKGLSIFFQISLPVMPEQNDGTADFMTFDAQLRYIDCPTEIPGAYSNVTVDRGWQLILSKNYGLFQIPQNAYQTGDVLYGNNGAMLYNITNT